MDGPRTDPWGIPWLNGERGEYNLSIILEIVRLVRYEVNQCNAKPDIPIKVSREINMLWSSVSKIDERSSGIIWKHVLLFNVNNIMSVIRSRAVSVD